MQEASSQLQVHASRWNFSGRTVLAAFAFAIPFALTAASLLGHAGYELTAFGDLSQFFLLVTATVLFLRRGVLAEGTCRAFWLLIALGFGLWSTNMTMWVYSEVIRNRPVPSIPFGEFLLFIKQVPMIAALALMPNNDRPGRPRLLGFLDLTSLLVYWTYIYLFWAMAYRIAGHNIALYNRNSDIVDAVGNALFLLILAAVALRSRGAWRRFYLQFLGAAATYALSSILLNHAITVGGYYTGSIYDVPLTAALAWFCIIAITSENDSQTETGAQAEEPKTESATARKPVLWAARVSMLATLSTPAIGLWLALQGDIQEPVRHFRIVLTLSTMLLATILLLLKQDLLNFKLSGNLRDASLAYLDLKRFQNELVQNEKLASLGKLVARVAHEIHRAMVVVAKDVELLSARSTTNASREKMTTKIGDAAQRTNHLVESMLSFAQETPLQRTAVSVLPLLERALSLTRVERRHNVRVAIEEQGAIGMVEGDANQLVQVFLHIIANAIDAMEGHADALLTIVVRTEQEFTEIEFADTGMGLKDPKRVFEPFYTTKAVGKGVGLGLSTCYGIVRQHGGEIVCENRPEGGAVFKVVIPAAAIERVEIGA